MLIGFLSIVNRAALRLSRSSVTTFIVLGMVVALNYSTFFQSVEYLGVSVSVAIFYVYPALTALAAWLLLREPFQFKIILALVLTVAGCVLVSGALQTKVSLSSAGIALGLVSASSYAAYITIVRKTVRTNPPEKVLTFSLLFSLPWLLIATKLVHTPFFPKLILLPWVYIFTLALVPTVLGYYFFAAALRHVNATQASILATLEPVLAASLALVVLGERLTYVQVMGVALIIGGALFTQWRRPQRRRLR